MAGYNFSDWITAVATLIEIPITNPALAAPSSDPNFNNYYPRAIEFAEQRIYRELDLLNTRVTDDTGSLTANSRRFSLPTSQGIILVLEELAVFNPPGTRNVLIPTARQFMDMAYPSDTPPSTPSVPQYYALVDQGTVIVGPPPSSAFGMETVGTVRPLALSATNTATMLTQYFPDVFLAASMVAWAGYQRDYGQQSDDPQLAMSWEHVYEAAIKSAGIEEFRKKHEGQGWGTKLPSPIATPAQT